eukprot:217733-Rhodomonas_salina.1
MSDRYAASVAFWLSFQEQSVLHVPRTAGKRGRSPSTSRAAVLRARISTQYTPISQIPTLHSLYLGCLQLACANEPLGQYWAWRSGCVGR